MDASGLVRYTRILLETSDLIRYGSILLKTSLIGYGTILCCGSDLHKPLSVFSHLTVAHCHTLTSK